MPQGNAHTQGRGGLVAGGPPQFGSQTAWQAPDGNKRWQGVGGYGLGDAFANWDAASRYAFSPAAGYENQLQPSLNHFQGQMNKDWSSELFGQSQKAINSQFGAMQSQRKQANARSGSAGGAGVSPMMQYQLNQEASARSGALGTAARQAVFQAEQMKTQGARGYQDTLANIYQAYMAPAYLQSAGATRTPVGGGRGPSPVGAGMNFAAAGINALA